MVVSSRILPAQKIVSPLGNLALGPEDEKILRRSLVKMALASIQAELEGQKVFPLNQWLMITAINLQKGDQYEHEKGD